MTYRAPTCRDRHSPDIFRQRYRSSGRSAYAQASSELILMRDFVVIMVDGQHFGFCSIRRLLSIPKAYNFLNMLGKETVSF